MKPWKIEREIGENLFPNFIRELFLNTAMTGTQLLLDNKLLLVYFILFSCAFFTCYKKLYFGDHFYKKWHLFSSDIMHTNLHSSDEYLNEVEK